MQAPRALALCHCFTGALDFQAGDWANAEIVLGKAIELYRQVGSASGEALSLQRLGVLVGALGRFEEARDLLSLGLVVAERASMRAHCLTRLHASMTRTRLAAGDLKEASLSLEEGLYAAKRHGHCVTCNALLLPEAVRVSLAHEDVAAAAAYATELEKIASGFSSALWSAMAGHARGRVLLAQRKHKQAADCLETARRSYEALGQDYERARCQRDLADALSRRKGEQFRARANDLEADTRAILTTLGAVDEDAPIGPGPLRAG